MPFFSPVFGLGRGRGHGWPLADRSARHGPDLAHPLGVSAIRPATLPLKAAGARASLRPGRAGWPAFSVRFTVTAGRWTDLAAGGCIESERATQPPVLGQSRRAADPPPPRAAFTFGADRAQRGSAAAEVSQRPHSHGLAGRRAARGHTLSDRRRRLTRRHRGARR